MFPSAFTVDHSLKSGGPFCRGRHAVLSVVHAFFFGRVSARAGSEKQPVYNYIITVQEGKGQRCVGSVTERKEKHRPYCRQTNARARARVPGAVVYDTVVDSGV